MSEPEPLPAFADQAPRDRYCDLVLTGGITSSIAYPSAIFALAQAYRFNSIGGSSSGAGAAALAAAAEYRRRRGSADGYRLLLERTAVVADEVDGKARLEWLFQPEPGQQRLYAALLHAVARPAVGSASIGIGVLRAYGGVAALGAGLMLAIVGLPSLSPAGSTPIGWVLALAVAAVVALCGALLAIGLAAAGDLRRLVRNDYGLCSGYRAAPDPRRPPLTNWLHALVQELAGRRPEDPPLTFADLAGAPGSPHDTLGVQGAGGRCSIDLRMFAANVTHGRPCLLPQDEADADPPLYFRPREMRRLFPPTVVEHLIAHGARLEGQGEDDDEALRRLPAQQLPVLVAARMSVAFPLLFTAVPLWSIDERDPQRRPRRCLFADGGLCSGFPIHLFDSLIPAWPTFGIALYDHPPTDKTAAGLVDVSSHHRDGRHERWHGFDERDDELDRLGGLAAAMLATTKDWNDAALARLPGVRDRIARVGLPPGIGGLNIRMKRAQIRFLAELGAEAGRRLLQRYALPEGPDGIAAGWREHRWVRFNLLADLLSRALAGTGWSAAQARHALPLRRQIRAALAQAPLQGEGEAPLQPAQAATLEGLLSALAQAEQVVGAGAVEPAYRPDPRPELRVRPPL